MGARARRRDRSAARDIHRAAGPPGPAGTGTGKRHPIAALAAAAALAYRQNTERVCASCRNRGPGISGFYRVDRRVAASRSGASRGRSVYTVHGVYAIGPGGSLAMSTDAVTAVNRDSDIAPAAPAAYNPRVQRAAVFQVDARTVRGRVNGTIKLTNVERCHRRNVQGAGLIDPRRLIARTGHVAASVGNAGSIDGTGKGRAENGRRHHHNK